VNLLVMHKKRMWCNRSGTVVVFVSRFSIREC